MAAIPPRPPSKLRHALLALTITFLPLAPLGVKADISQEAPKAAPQAPVATAQDRRPGETLSERLDRNSGVIHPPAGMDPGIAVPVPDPNPNSTPVIPPPGTPGGNPSVQPK